MGVSFEFGPPRIVDAISKDSTITSLIGTDCGVNDSIFPSSEKEIQ